MNKIAPNVPKAIRVRMVPTYPPVAEYNREATKGPAAIAIITGAAIAPLTAP